MDLWSEAFCPTALSNSGGWEEMLMASLMTTKKPPNSLTCVHSNLQAKIEKLFLLVHFVLFNKAPRCRKPAVLAVVQVVKRIP